jgi:hypothetical protein
VVILVYVLSYVPVVRLMGGWTTYATFDYHGVPQVVKKPIFSDELPVYMPVDWLIDNTPFEDPLMEWAGFCGVRGPFVRR